MPRRPSIHFGTSTSPHHSSNAVNEVVSAISRKLTAHHLENASSSSPAPRRPSFSMDSILHPNKDKKRNDSKDRGASDKRKSLGMLHGGKSKDRSSSGQSPKLAPVKPGKFEVVIESGPLVSYGSVANSTGALMSGRLKLIVQDPSGEVTVDKLTVVFRAAISAKKPIIKDCADCKERYDELKTENLLNEPKTFKKGDDNQFPFSHLFEGHLAATTVATLGSLTYELVARAHTTQGETIEIVHPLVIQRAIHQGPDKSSIRIFPPTNLTGRVTLPPVVFPIGKFPVTLQLSGIVEKKSEVVTRWRLRKVLWHIEETVKMVSKPCTRHLDKVKEGKAIQNTDMKIIGSDELKSGWKTDFGTAGGEITFEFEAALSSKSNHRPVCDVDSAAGLEVKHVLVLELIIAEEFVSQKNSSIITPTGSARVLRMQFNLIVSQRGGMNISWDEEMPPMYEDIPDSPPGYGNADPKVGVSGGAVISDYHGPELEYEELEQMKSEDPNDPPRYRERDPKDVNQGLPMRPAAARQVATGEAGPSGTQGQRRQGGWTNDELETEPPSYALRRRASDEPPPEDDYAEGETAANTA